MKIKKLLFVLLSVALFACGNDADFQPDVLSPDGVTPPPPSGFSIGTNFSLIGTDGKKAELSFGTQSMTENLTIKVGYKISTSSATGYFNDLPSPYNDIVIPAYNTFSGYYTVNTEDFGICQSQVWIKMFVQEVRWDGQLIPASDYTVHGMNSDGSTTLEMAGTGYCGGSGQPGDVSLDKFLDKVEDKLILGDM